MLRSTTFRALQPLRLEPRAASGGQGRGRAGEPGAPPGAVGAGGRGGRAARVGEGGGWGADAAGGGAGPQPAGANGHARGAGEGAADAPAAPEGVFGRYRGRGGGARAGKAAGPPQAEAVPEGQSHGRSAGALQLAAPQSAASPPRRFGPGAGQARHGAPPPSGGQQGAPGAPSRPPGQNGAEGFGASGGPPSRVAAAGGYPGSGRGHGGGASGSYCEEIEKELKSRAQWTGTGSVTFEELMEAGKVLASNGAQPPPLSLAAVPGRPGPKAPPERPAQAQWPAARPPHHAAAAQWPPGGPAGLWAPPAGGPGGPGGLWAPPAALPDVSLKEARRALGLPPAAEPAEPPKSGANKMPARSRPATDAAPAPPRGLEQLSAGGLAEGPRLHALKDAAAGACAGAWGSVAATAAAPAGSPGPTWARFEPEDFTGVWVDIKGNPVNVVNGAQEGRHAKLTANVSRPPRKDVVLKIELIKGVGWHCGNAELDSTWSTTEELHWVREDGFRSVWTRARH
ncbi:unnamed protein product [Prorocentrum cordatum]|uniref:Uncharacterized protein n=1 Tax=Prorocentrum cordatum TaxID=2364126 RepID=A0ABN9UDX4_9DINO|nr:unnamed protein product [Polarella glacialis]